MLNRNLYIALIVWAATLLPNTSLAAFVTPEANDSSFYSRYPYIQMVDEPQSRPVISDKDFFDRAAKVVFRVNEFVLPQNDALLRELEQTVIPRINRDSLKLRYMMIRGAASPEGPFSVNKRLGEQRAKALFDFVNSRLALPVDDSQFSLDVEIEDYRSLCQMMQRAGDSDYALVQSLCDEYLPTEQYAPLKLKLQTARGGQLWPRLLRDYCPQLRSARLVLFLEDSKAVVEPVIVPVADTVAVTTPVAPADTIVPAVSVLDNTDDASSLRLPRRELLSVKTNLLLDAAYVPGYDRWCPIPNIAVEYYPLHGHFTFGASFDMPWWQDYKAHKYFQLRNYQLEARYYLRSGSIEQNAPGQGAAFRGFYLQGYAHGGVFGICFDANRGWVGEGIGGGIGAGYVLPLSRTGHWRLEFSAQVGYFTCKYDPYQYENPVDPYYHDDLYYYKWSLDPALFKKRQYRFNWLGPTRVGITLSYDLLYRRQAKKGASFRSYEPVIK